MNSKGKRQGVLRHTSLENVLFGIQGTPEIVFNLRFLSLWIWRVWASNLQYSIQNIYPQRCIAVDILYEDKRKFCSEER